MAKITKHGGFTDRYAPSYPVGLLPAGPVEEEAAPSVPAPPPLRGTGSGRQAWADYAESLGIEVFDNDTKAELVEAVAGLD